jgi:hypothetical protein
MANGEGLSHIVENNAFRQALGRLENSRRLTDFLFELFPIHTAVDIQEHRYRYSCGFMANGTFEASNTHRFLRL